MTHPPRQPDSQALRATGADALPPLPELGPRPRTRSEQWVFRVAAALFGVLWLTALLIKTGIRPDEQQLPWMYAHGLPALLFAAGAGMIGLALASGAKGVGASPRWVRLAVVALPLLFALSSLWTEIGPSSVVPASFAQAWPAHLACGLTTFVLGAGPFAIALLVLRRAFPSGFVGRGALVGLGCGLAATAAIHMHCPMALSSHILVAHGAPLLALTVLGAALAHRVLRT